MNLYNKSTLKTLATCSYILLFAANFLLVTEIILYVLKVQKNFQENILYFFFMSLIITFFMIKMYLKSEEI
ncbi:hypothetical protein [Cloacibacterium normanense]|uniref:Putative membrane protein n=1 Tax=Cloacibacterium normanense TaxID=237258 RepID=A0A1E5UFY3_9FLAO|nr:hypothetical protein [Cloacibacterium normanense]AZI70325.1 hypothetical protein EB819_10740 [Cloacibacterium normanense]OEL11816.1 putative membrane protein [Cloacibacterium normanense]SDO84710.1 hypothetical protein SAMN04489756_12214 [Cloacibacterium normanense]